MTKQSSSLITPVRLKRKWTPTQWLRLGSQLLFLALTANAVIRHRINEAAGLDGPANQAPGVDALSPMGGLETLWTWIQSGTTLKHLHPSDLVLLVAAVLLVVVLGPAFCGWICPFGTIQEWLYRLRTHFIPWQLHVPPKVDRVLRYGRFVVLALVLYATYSMGEFIFGDYCPWKAAWNLGSTEIAIGGAIVLSLVVVGGLLVERAWCRYFCPLGGFLGLFNKIAPVKLRRSTPACTSCGLCSRKCPVGIDLNASDVVSSTSCTRCLECVDACPRSGALELKAGWWPKARTLKGVTYGLVAVALFGGVILTAKATDNWQATASTAPPAVDSATGLVNPDEIKGWRTLQEVTDLWKIPQDLLYRELGLDPAQVPPATKLKDLEVATANSAKVIDRSVVADLVLRWQKGEVK